MISKCYLYKTRNDYLVNQCKPSRQTKNRDKKGKSYEDTNKNFRSKSEGDSMLANTIKELFASK